jgi:5,10-methylene-tetrahydrofolate dehydrogenase/methenyl tetrahydrofolate cyclohydrolase
MRLKDRVTAIKARYKIIPHLAIIHVGSRQDSAAYVRMKEKAAMEVIEKNSWIRPVFLSR